MIKGKATRIRLKIIFAEWADNMVEW